MNPWPGAFTFLPDGGDARKVKIFDASPNPDSSGPPGQVLYASAHGILVGCGSGSVLLREIQMEGGRRMAAGDFLRGRPAPPGTILPVRP